MKKLSLALSSLLTVFVGSVLAQDDYTVPRTGWGQPDLEGVWNFSTNIPMQRPAFFGDKEFLTDDEIEALAAQTELGLQALNNSGSGGYNTFWLEMGTGKDNRTSLITYPENGRLPEIVEGTLSVNGGLGPDVEGDRPVRFIVGGISKDGPEDRGLSERCLVGFNAGPPFTPNLYNNNIQIVQSKDTIALVTEMVHTTRIIPIDGRPHLDDDVRLWSGNSRGYWDGDTLVVVTRNFNDYTQSFSGLGTAKDKVLTERFTRTDAYTMEYEFTVEDPSTFRDKVVAMVTMAKVDGQIYEYACHEGNYGMVNLLRGERMTEQRESEASR
ncbi:MAG: hypothetical protein MI746_09050 [Pseudomonadales bacterium]|nr:hypothetical protein [Pseudomonadales bacterium]